MGYGIIQGSVSGSFCDSADMKIEVGLLRNKINDSIDSKEKETKMECPKCGKQMDNLGNLSRRVEIRDRLARARSEKRIVV
jgi:hypothetical protein